MPYLEPRGNHMTDPFIRQDEVDCTPIADAMKEEIQYRLAMMGFGDATVEMDTLDVWIKIIVKSGDREMDWKVDVSELSECGNLRATISEVSLKIAIWLGKELNYAQDPG